MLKLGCDLDDCIVDTSTWCINYINQKYSLIKTIEDKVNYDIGMMYPTLGISKVKEAIFATISATDFAPIPKSIEVLNSWSNSYTKLPLFVVSHRPMEVFGSTGSMLITLGLKNFYLEFSKNGGSFFRAMSMPNKADIINKYGIDIFIEDRIDTSEDIINKTNCTVILFNRPWNSVYTKFSNRLFYAQSWQEIDSLLAFKFSGIL